MSGINELRHRLALQVADEVEDGAGGVVRTWEPLGDVWASIEPINAREQEVADKRLGLLTHKILLRHRNDITLSNRFVLGARHFIVRAVHDHDERGRWLECLVAEERP